MKIVIYTTLCGSYDTLQQPLNIKDNYNYICYSNDIQKNEIGVWQIRKIPYQTEDKPRLSRYPKMHPHILLEEYDYSVYMDANMQIINESFYKLIKDKIAVGTKLAGVRHSFRDCVYDEGYVVFTYRLEKNMLMLVRQMRFLKKKGLLAISVCTRQISFSATTMIQQCTSSANYGGYLSTNIRGVTNSATRKRSGNSGYNSIACSQKIHPRTHFRGCIFLRTSAKKNSGGKT